MSASPTTSIYHVRGMTCEHCRGAVRGAIAALAGVTAVDVDLAAGLVRVTGVDVNTTAIVKAVADEGYEVAS